ncbi:Mu-like prophage protein gpG [Sphingobium faniae]|nr:Mu-like prophage protein gpG [Sphingobium faniae]
MGAGFDLSVQLDDAALDAALSQAIKDGADLRRPMGEIAEEWLEHVRARFQEERDPMGVPWMKRRLDPNAPINVKDASRKLLHLTGDLERVIVPEFGSDFAQIGVQKTAGPARYARIHNEGGTIRPRKAGALSFGGRIVSQVVMPKRQYVGFGDAERRSVMEILTDFVRDLFGKPAA